MRRRRGLRILAIDARRNRFGYALFEGSRRLLDWGASSVSPQMNTRSATQSARKRVTPLLKRSHPAAIIVKRLRRTRTGKSSTPGPILRTIETEAARLQIPLYFLRRKEIRSIFGDHEGKTKYDIAEFLVGMFPELSIRLPPRRKRWQSEPHVMTVFDAVAVGFTFWKRNGAQLSPSQS
jgi:hypothetical protein